MSDAPMSDAPRIALIHALEESIPPIRKAFAEIWPEAQCFDLLDTSLAVDLAHAGQLDDAMIGRFLTLADYMAGATGKDGQAQAILFTCSAFGPAIEAVKQAQSIPVLRPNEAAFDKALDLGDRLGLVVTFAPSLPALSAELHQMAAARGRKISIAPVLAEGALAALKAGDGATHDRLVAEACKDLTGLDAIVLGQFSLARAAAVLQPMFACPILTTPACAVEALRARLTL